MSDEVTAVETPTQPIQGENGVEKKSDAMTANQLMQFLQEKEASVAPQQQEGETPSENTEPETVEPEAKAEGDDESDVLSQLSLDDIDPRYRPAVDAKLKRMQEKVEKRIGKEVRKTKESQEKLTQAEQQIAQLAQQLEAARTAPKLPDPIGKNPLDDVADMQGLEEKRMIAKRAARFADELLAEGVPEQGVEIEGAVYTKKDLLTIKRNATETLEDHIPARYQFLAMQKQAQEQAAKTFPWLNDKSSREYQTAQFQLAQAPWLSKLPNKDFLVGVFVEGLKALESKSAPTSKAKPPVDQVAKSAASSGAPRVDSQTLQREKVSSQFKELGKKGNLSAANLAKILAQKS